MSSPLGTPLAPAPKMVVWVWFAIAVGLAVLSAWQAMKGQVTWFLAAVFAGMALLIYLEPRLRRREYETVQVDEIGVLRVDGSVREEIGWESVAEIRIVTNDAGPFAEDVFFVLAGSDGKACVVSHAAAVRMKLLEALQMRFPNLDAAAVISAMGSASNSSFLLWKKPAAGAASIAPAG